MGRRGITAWSAGDHLVETAATVAAVLRGISACREFSFLGCTGHGHRRLGDRRGGRARNRTQAGPFAPGPVIRHRILGVSRFPSEFGGVPADRGQRLTYPFQYAWLGHGSSGTIRPVRSYGWPGATSARFVSAGKIFSMIEATPLQSPGDHDPVGGKDGGKDWRVAAKGQII